LKDLLMILPLHVNNKNSKLPDKKRGIALKSAAAASYARRGENRFYRECIFVIDRAG
jgi:hypothetical protein